MDNYIIRPIKRCFNKKCRFIENNLCNKSIFDSYCEKRIEFRNIRKQYHKRYTGINKIERLIRV